MKRARLSPASEILEFDEAVVKVDEAELWVALGSSKFKFHQRTTDRRMRVFWPGEAVNGVRPAGGSD